MLNYKTGVNQTHYDVNWMYNCQNSKETGYYFKTRALSVRMISYLPESNKDIDKDFLIVVGEWHDNLHCPTRDGEPDGMFIGPSKLFYP